MRPHTEISVASTAATIVVVIEMENIKKSSSPFFSDIRHFFCFSFSLSFYEWPNHQTNKKYDKNDDDDDD